MSDFQPTRLRQIPIKVSPCFALALTLLIGSASGALNAESKGGRGLLGVELQAEGNRARVISVTPGGPAAKVGLAPGDFVVAFNGASFHFSTDHELIEGLAWMRPGQPVHLALLRQGQKRDLVVVPRAATASEQEAMDRWLNLAHGEEERLRRERAASDFEAMVRHQPVDVTFRRTAAGVETSSKTLLPRGLDLHNYVLDGLTEALHVKDQMVIRYSWENAKNALKMDIQSSPPYVDLGAVLGAISGGKSRAKAQP